MDTPASHAALCTACRGVRSHEVPVALTGELIELRELEIIALAVHADSDVTIARPAVQPRAQGPECSVIRRYGSPRWTVG